MVRRVGPSVREGKEPTGLIVTEEGEWQWSTLRGRIQPRVLDLTPGSPAKAAPPIMGALAVGPSLPDKGPQLGPRPVRPVVMAPVRKVVTLPEPTGPVKRQPVAVAAAAGQRPVSPVPPVLAPLSVPMDTLVLGVVITPVEGLRLETGFTLTQILGPGDEGLQRGMARDTRGPRLVRSSGRVPNEPVLPTKQTGVTPESVDTTRPVTSRSPSVGRWPPERTGGIPEPSTEWSPVPQRPEVAVMPSTNTDTSPAVRRRGSAPVEVGPELTPVPSVVQRPERIVGLRPVIAGPENKSPFYSLFNSFFPTVPRQKNYLIIPVNLTHLSTGYTQFIGYNLIRRSRC